MCYSTNISDSYCVINNVHTCKCNSIFHSEFVGVVLERNSEQGVSNKDTSKDASKGTTKGTSKNTDKEVTKMDVVADTSDTDENTVVKSDDETVEAVEVVETAVKSTRKTKS